MQTPILPLPTIGANAAAAPKVNFNASGQDNQFQRALSREMENRQQTSSNSNAPARKADRTPAPQAGAKPAAPAKQLNSQPTRQADADAGDKNIQPGGKSEPATTDASTTTTASASAAKDDSDTDAANSDAQAAMDGPVSDMLALVAAFNQPVAAAPAAAAPVAGGDAAGAAAALAADAAAATALPSAADAQAALAIDPALADAAADSAATDADAALDFKALLTQAGAAKAAPDAAASAADAAAAAAAAAATAAASAAPAAPLASAATQIKPDAATKSGDQPADLAAIATDAPADGKHIDSGADTINKIETKAAPADSGQLQAALGREPKADAIAIPTIKGEARADGAAMIKEAAPAVTIAPTATAALESAKAAAMPSADKLSARVGTQAWDQQLGQKVIFMAAGGEQSATMELNPPDLGPLQVVLSVNKDQATAAFSSAQPEVRAALEAAMPKLREMMSDAGIQLGNATVSAGMSNQNNGFNQQAASAQFAGGNGGGNNGSGSRFGNDSANGDALPRSAPPPLRLPAGAVDTFA